MQQLLETWGAIYSNHPALRASIEFLHVGGLLGGGGLAVAADRAMLQLGGVSAPSAAREARLLSLHGTHRLVIAGLLLVIVSGLLLAFADLDTFLYSKVFWLKMALIVLLLGNGLALVRQETRALAGHEPAWRRLRLVACASLALWFSITLLGSALPNLG